MTQDEADVTHRYDNGEWKPTSLKWWFKDWHQNPFAWSLIVALVVLLFSVCRAEEFCFAPGSPAAFRTMVRKVIAARSPSENWVEVKPVKFWSPAPLTFQAVRTAFITPSTPGQYWSLPRVEGKIYRNGNVAAWLFRSGAPRDFITINIRNRTKKEVMMQDLNFEIDLWLKGNE